MATLMLPESDQNNAYIKTYSKITQDHARDLIRNHYEIGQNGQLLKGRTNDIGCWMATDLASTHTNGYIQKNLRRTTSREPAFSGQLIGGTILMHQLAAIATGNRERLEWCGRNWHSSHLCHNGKCFNPEHIWIEEGWINKWRNTCQGQKQVRIKKINWTYHPCTHSEVGIMKRCVLPTVDYDGTERFPQNSIVEGGEAPRLAAYRLAEKVWGKHLDTIDADLAAVGVLTVVQGDAAAQA